MTLSHLGADEAAAIRRYARELAAIPDIASTSSSREILHDLSVALTALIDPVRALVEDHLDDGPDDVEYAQGARDAVEALLGAASGIRHVADNH